MVQNIRLMQKWFLICYDETISYKREDGLDFVFKMFLLLQLI